MLGMISTAFIAFVACCGVLGNARTIETGVSSLSGIYSPTQVYRVNQDQLEPVLQPTARRNMFKRHVKHKFPEIGPPTTGGEFTFGDEGIRGSVMAEKKPGYGIDLGAKAIIDIWRSEDGNTAIGAVGSVRRHFGGISGNGPYDFGTGIEFSHRFR